MTLHKVKKVMIDVSDSVLKTDIGRSQRKDQIYPKQAQGLQKAPLCHGNLAKAKKMGVASDRLEKKSNL